MDPGVRFLGTTAVFATADVMATAEYYRDRLGFRIAWMYTEDDPTFACVSRDMVEVFLSKQPDKLGMTEDLQQYFVVDQVDLLHDEHVVRGADITLPIGDRPWGMREYTVRDPNGYRLRFSSPILSRTTEDAALPTGFRIVERRPTPDEFERIEVSANPQFTPPEYGRVMHAPLLAMVAEREESGEAVGMAMVSGDGVNILYIHDVAVMAEFQGRGIGSALMNRVMEELRARCQKGVAVMLRTGKPNFYSSSGFRIDGGAMVVHL